MCRNQQRHLENIPFYSLRVLYRNLTSPVISFVQQPDPSVVKIRGLWICSCKLFYQMEYTHTHLYTSIISVLQNEIAFVVSLLVQCHLVDIHHRHPIYHQWKIDGHLNLIKNNQPWFDQKKKKNIYSPLTFFWQWFNFSNPINSRNETTSPSSNGCRSSPATVTMPS